MSLEAIWCVIACFFSWRVCFCLAGGLGDNEVSELLYIVRFLLRADG